MKGYVKGIVSAVILLLCTAVPVAGIFWYESARTRGITAEILCRAPERGNFLVKPLVADLKLLREQRGDGPRKLSVPVGEKVRLRVRNVDTVTHGFAIPALDIEGEDIKAGQQRIIEFTPEKPGRYDFYCTAWCSEHHLQMRGVLEVVAK